MIKWKKNNIQKDQDNKLTYIYIYVSFIVHF